MPFESAFPNTEMDLISPCGFLQHHFTPLVSTTSPTTVLDIPFTGPPDEHPGCAAGAKTALLGRKDVVQSALEQTQQSIEEQTCLLLKSNESPHILQRLATQAA